MKKIVIVGSGTAGAICSSYLKTFWKDKVDITLIYDESKEVIGVGESTTPSIFEFLKFIGINSYELLKYTNTTLKLGIKFKNWNNDGKHFYHNFSEPNIQPNTVNNTYFLSSAYSLLHNDFDNDLYLQDYFLEKDLVPKNFPNDIQHALHIDAYKFSQYILDRFRSQLKIINQKIERVICKNNSIEKLILESGEEIKADLYIDASGFSKVLFKELNSEWVNKEDYLPLNRAIPNPIKKIYKKIPTFTLAESTRNGWIWQIPLQDRYGSGYNYSSNFTTDEDAKKDFDKWLSKNHNVSLESDRIIKYETGYYKDQWIGNCICIGLSSGFVEPLESTAIHTIIRQTFYIATYYSLDINEFSRKKYNKKVRNIYDTILDFIRIHYYLKRNDSEFHLHMNKNTPKWIKEFDEKINHSFMNHYDFLTNDDLFTTINYIIMSNGLKLIKDKNAYRNYLSNNNFDDMGKYFHLQQKDIKKTNRINPIGHKELILNIKNS